MILRDGIRVREGAAKTLAVYLIERTLTLGIIALFFALWQLASHFVSAVILPPPLDALGRLGEVFGAHGGEIATTFKRATIAIVAAFACGTTLGCVAANLPSFARAVKPATDILQGIPPIVWIVIALFWFGVGDFSVVFTCFVTLMPLSFGAAFASVWGLNSNLSEVCVAYRLGWWRALRVFWLPSVLPFMLTNLSIVFAMGVKIAVMAELLGASDGVGAQIFAARNFLDAELIFAYVVVLVASILLFEALVIKPLKIIFLPWEERNVGA